jgi:hypothetical protein
MPGFLMTNIHTFWMINYLFLGFLLDDDQYAGISLLKCLSRGYLFEFFITFSLSLSLSLSIYIYIYFARIIIWFYYCRYDNSHLNVTVPFI